MKVTSKTRLALAVWSAAIGALVPTTARAYSAPGLYAGSPSGEGGGGGRYFTGSRRDGYVCSVCHVGDAGPTVTLDGAPVGAYEPGAVYTFDLHVNPGELTRVALTGEVVDAEGVGLGHLSLAPKDLLTDEERCAGGGHGGALFETADGRHVAALQDCLATRLRFQWHAPEAGHGPAFVHVAAIAADGEGTPENDGVTLLRSEVAELGAEAGDGCRAAGRVGPLGLVPLGLVAWRRGRRAMPSRTWRAAAFRRVAAWWVSAASRLIAWRRATALRVPAASWLIVSRRAAVVLVLTTLTSGCARVKPYERGRLAQPDMQLKSDEDISAGQLHATEYREGSVGGEGGGGGGCGCN